MKRTIITIASLFLAATLHGAGLTDASLRAIRFDQKPGAQISPDLLFHDEDGNAVTLGDYLGRRPVILVPGYYGCPMLCTLVLNGLVESMQDVKWTAGDQFEVINYSIDPTEKPSLAADKNSTYLRRYGRAGAEHGWHFLTGNADAIAKLSDKIGFHYAYDPAIRQYAHPSGFVVLTPQGKIERYFFGVDFAGKDLDAALRSAAANEKGSRIRDLLLLCFHYSPITSKYGALILNCVRILGTGTALFLGVWIVRSITHDRAKKPT